MQNGNYDGEEPIMVGSDLVRHPSREGGGRWLERTRVRVEVTSLDFSRKKLCASTVLDTRAVPVVSTLAAHLGSLGWRDIFLKICQSQTCRDSN